MQFTVEKMYCLPDAGNLRAFADVCIDEQIVIRRVRVFNGKHGLFVSLSQEQGKDNKWYDQVVCKQAPTYERLSKVVIEHYNAVHAPEPTVPMGDPVGVWTTAKKGVRL